MAEISASLVKQLREMTGAGMMECKRALTETDGDLEKAKDLLRKKGMAKHASLAGRAANEGVVVSYTHSSGGSPARVGALVELNCETDFVARNDDFQRLARELALQVAGARPTYVRREDIPADVLDREKGVYADQIKGKPENIVEKILAGKLEAFFQDVCLVDQEYIRVDEAGQKKRIRDLIGEVGGKLRENITVAGFVRFEVGQPAHVARSLAGASAEAAELSQAGAAS